MPNQFANTNWVCMDVLRLLLNKRVISEYFDTTYEREFEREFAPGATVTVKFPQRFLTTDGMQYAPQAINRITTTVSLDQWIQCSFEYDDYEKAVKLERSQEELEENYLEPLAEALKQEIDSRCAKFAYQNANNVVGVLGTDPTTVNPYHAARQRLAELACPPGKRVACISSSMMKNLGVNVTNYFHPADEFDRIWKEGAFGSLATFKFFESNSLYSHTAGTWAGSVTVTGAGQSGSSLIITGTLNDTIKKGDKFSIANVNQVNPMTRRIPGASQVKHFVALNDYTLSGSADTIQIAPAIYGPGSQYQNVDALPVNGAALTLWPGTSSPNGKVGTVGLALSKFAFALVGARLYLPKAVETRGEANDDVSGLSMRMVKAWDPVRSVQVNRSDMLLGFGSLYQDNGAVCIAGA